MSTLRPEGLSNDELVRIAYSLVGEGPLPIEWQKELIDRLERAIGTIDALAAYN